MIRVNLLRKDALKGLPAAAGGGSAFISRREVALAGIFLLLGGLILWFVLSDNSEPAPAVVAENAPPAAVSASEPPALSSSISADPVPAVAASEPSLSAADSGPNQISAAASSEPEGPRRSSILSSRAAAARVASSVTSAANDQTAAVLPSTVAPAVLSEQTATVNILHELRIQRDGDRLQILAATDRAPQYKMFRLDHPARVVIDMPGVRHEIPSAERQQTISSKFVRGVRIAQNQIDPPIVRLVLEVSSFPELQVLAQSDGLLIDVSGKP